MNFISCSDNYWCLVSETGVFIYGFLNWCWNPILVKTWFFGKICQNSVRATSSRFSQSTTTNFGLHFLVGWCHVQNHLCSRCDPLEQLRLYKKCRVDNWCNSGNTGCESLVTSSCYWIYTSHLYTTALKHHHFSHLHLHLHTLNHYHIINQDAATVKALHTVQTESETTAHNSAVNTSHANWGRNEY